MYEYKAYIESVYDGDTVTAVLDLGLNVSVREKLRLNRINAPEVRGQEKERGYAARDWLRRRITSEWVIVRTLKDRKGKYGRYLAELEARGVNINDEMVQAGHAEYKDY